MPRRVLVQVDLTGDDAPVPLRRANGAGPSGARAAAQPRPAGYASPARAVQQRRGGSTDAIITGVVPPVAFPPVARPAPAAAAPPPPPPEERPQCPLCLDDMKDELCSVPCGHVFHYSCIKDAFKKGFKKCPKCRKAISGEKQIKRIFFS